MLGKTIGDVGKTGTLGKTLKAIGEDIKEDSLGKTSGMTGKTSGRSGKMRKTSRVFA